MAKKAVRLRNEKPQATFEVRFRAPGISPEKVSLRNVSDALSAIQDLASGRDAFETPFVSPEKAIGLVDVRKGSAVYACVAHSPAEAWANLSRIRNLLDENEMPSEDDDDILAKAFKPIQTLCDVARSLGCRLEVAWASKRRQPPLFTVGQGDYERIAARMLLKGETTIAGKIERVGGATGMRCLLRVPGRRRILYCGIASRELARKLGQHLYEPIVARGTATWLHRSWRVQDFTIQSFSQPKLSDVDSAIKALRKAGLDAWDNVPDPSSYLHEQR